MMKFIHNAQLVLLFPFLDSALNSTSKLIAGIFINWVKSFAPFDKQTLLLKIKRFKLRDHQGLFD